MVLQNDSSILFQEVDLISSSLDSILISKVANDDIIITNSPVKLSVGTKVTVK
jgi:hypothetical protein